MAAEFAHSYPCTSGTLALVAVKQFQLGQTVEFLKSFVESEFGIAMACQVRRMF